MKALTPRPRLAGVLLTGLLLCGACGDSNKETSEDGGPDATLADSGPRGPLARIYRNNPTDDKELTEVELAHLTDPDGKLTGKYVDAYNCVNKPGGEAFDVDLGVGMTFKGYLCTLEKTVTPGGDGTYLHVEAPKWHGNGSDPFAELMMYHHVTTIHDYFKAGLGLTHMDRPLRAIVNLQAYIETLGRWLGLVNAAYIPKESASIFKQFGVNILDDQDAIVFIQGDSVDTAYDASVIYHEYTHAVIGRALQGNAADRYGTDPTPSGFNEALADYFAASRLDTPVVGSYALGSVDAARDLSRTFRCPEHIVGEPHHDGEIAAGALWKLRTLLGAKAADGVIMKAVLTFTPKTTFAEGATAILDEVKSAAPAQEAAARKIFEDSGMLGCSRLVEHVDYDHTGKSVLSPGYPGHSPSYPDGTPEYLQRKVEVAATTKELEITWVAAGNGGMPGFPGAPAQLSVALSPGAAPITYSYEQSAATSTALAVLAPTKANTLTISGSCLKAGPLVFQLLNKSMDPGEIKALQVVQRDTVTARTPNFDGCAR